MAVLLRADMVCVDCQLPACLCLQLFQCECVSAFAVVWVLWLGGYIVPVCTVACDSVAKFEYISLHRRGANRFMQHHGGK